VADFVAEDLLLAAPEVLTEVATEATDQCSKPLVVTAVKNVKFLLDPQTVNLCTAVTVLKRWVIEVRVETRGVPKEVISGPPLPLLTKIKPHLTQ